MERPVPVARQSGWGKRAGCDVAGEEGRGRRGEVAGASGPIRVVWRIQSRRLRGFRVADDYHGFHHLACHPENDARDTVWGGARVEGDVHTGRSRCVGFPHRCPAHVCTGLRENNADESSSSTPRQSRAGAWGVFAGRGVMDQRIVVCCFDPHCVGRQRAIASTSPGRRRVLAGAGGCWRVQAGAGWCGVKSKRVGTGGGEGGGKGVSE